MTKRLAWVAMATTATYLVFGGGNWWGLYTPALRIVTMVATAVLLGGWLLAARRDPKWRPRSVMLPAIIACLSSLAISTAFSRYPRVSLEYLGYALVLVALYLLLVRLLADPFFRRRLTVLMSMLFAVIVAAFLVRVFLTWIEWWTLVGHVAVPPLRPGFEALTFGNPSAVLTMVALLAVPVLAMQAPGRKGAGIVVGVLGTIALVALLSGSRAGWFAIAATAALTAFLWSTRPDSRRTVRAGLRQVLARPAWVFAALALLGGAIVVAVVFGPALVRRATEGGEGTRLTFSIAALRMFAEAPIVGTGPGTWVIQRMAYTTAGEPNEYIPHAHNLETQSLAELGIVGTVAGAILVFNLVWVLRDGMRGDAARRRWSIVTALALVYFVLHQLLDFYVNMPAFLFAAAFPIAFLDATAERVPWRMRAPTGVRRVALPTAAALTFVSILGLLAQERPALDQAKVVALTDAGDWAAADATARGAAAADPQIGSYQLTAGLTADRAGDHEAARRAFEQVAQRDDLPDGWLNLAAEQATLGLRMDALASIQRALRLGIQHPAIAVPAGELALRLGDLDTANDAFVSSLLRVPSLASDPWWRRDPARSAALTRSASAADAVASEDVRWQLALMSGNDDLAVSLTGGSAATSFEADVIRTWHGDPAAGARVIATCRADPQQIQHILWCARVASRSGDSALADGFRRQADIIVGSSGVNGGEFRVAEVEYNKIPGGAADLWGLFTYRRQTPWNTLVPSLIHLTSL